VKGRDQRVQVFIKSFCEDNDNVNRSPEGNVVICCKFNDVTTPGKRALKQGTGSLIPDMNHNWQTHPNLVHNYGCGNVMYRSEWVITAAHCLKNDYEDPFIACVQVPAREKYATSLAQGTGPNAARRSGRFERHVIKKLKRDVNFFIFPEYEDSGMFGSDVALVKLPCQVERMMYMPWSWDYNLEQPKDVFISGYPAEESKCFIQYQACSEWFDENGNLIHSNMGFHKFKRTHGLALGTYTCQSTAGMSGGPVMLKHPDSGLYVRVGLHVQGGTRINSCTMFTPKVVEWIKEIQRNN